MARIRPLDPPYASETEALLREMMPAGVEPIRLFRTFVHNLPMTTAMRAWGSYELSRRLRLSLREREIVIDRTCARCGAEYEWGVHVAALGERAKLSSHQIASLTHGSAGDECWTERRERLLVRAVDSLHDTSDVQDTLWEELIAEFSEAELLDLVALCGWYHAISFLCRATRSTWRTMPRASLTWPVADQDRAAFGNKVCVFRR